VNYLTANWSYPAFSLFALAVALVHEIGLRALNARSTPAHARTRRRKMWLTYAGIAVLTLSVISPLEYWSMEYFWVHMIQHVTVMLAAPALYVAGAPAIPLIHAVPVKFRRRVLRALLLGRARNAVRRVIAFVFSPWVAVILFNAVMVLWMLPRIFNPVMGSADLHIGLMLGSFFVSGVLFWLQFIPSRPWKPQLSPFARLGTLLLTNLVMTLIAMSLSILASGPFYDIGNSMLGMTSMRTMVPITLNPFADQQIGAAILWVCGDFWCLPAIIMVLRLITRDDANSSLMDRILRGHNSMTAEEYRRLGSDEVTQ
jgi:cytochrome c oxidase assembly factor CtaG